MIQRPLLGSVSEDGSYIDFDYPQDFAKAKKAKAGQRVEVEIREPKSKRSRDQNAWIWGVAYPLLADALGYERHEIDEMHYGLVAKCFGEHFDKRLGAMVPNKRSSKLTIKEFSHYMEWLCRFGAELTDSVYIPLPDEASDEALAEGQPNDAA